MDNETMDNAKVHLWRDDVEQRGNDDNDDDGGEKCPRASQSFTRIKLNKIEKWNCCCYDCDFISTNWVSPCVWVWTRVKHAQVKYSSVFLVAAMCVGGNGNGELYSIFSISEQSANGSGPVSYFMHLFRWANEARISSCLLYLMRHTHRTQDTGKLETGDSTQYSQSNGDRGDNDNHVVAEIMSVIFPEFISFRVRRAQSNEANLCSCASCDNQFVYRKRWMPSDILYSVLTLLHDNLDWKTHRPRRKANTDQNNNNKKMEFIVVVYRITICLFDSIEI